MFKAACCVAASVLLFLPIAVWLYSAAPAKPAGQEPVAQCFVVPGFCHPEPGERLVYLCGIVFLPTTLFGLAFACRCWAGRLPRINFYLALSMEIAFAAGVAALSWFVLSKCDYFHLHYNQFFSSPLLAIPLLPALYLAMRWDWGGKRFIRPLLHLAALGLVGVIFLCDVFTDKYPYCSEFHFTAVFFPVVQVYQGKALLIDCASQYGLYPQLLQPLFAVVSLSVLTFTLVMGLLTAGSFAALYQFLWQACENKTAAFIGFAALLFNTWFSFALWANFDLYYQYFPIRLLFPAVLVPLAWRYLHRPSRRLYWGLLTFLSVGVLWNLDAGLPSLLTWALTLCFAELFGAGWRSVARRSVGHLAAAAGAFAAVAALYSCVVRLRYGAFPDYGQFFYYQRLYFVAGYYKSPLMPPTTWVLVALVYLAGLAYAGFALAARRQTPRAAMMFLLSVLGVGLSSYYQGSSNSIVLFLVWWPCLLLLALFLDDLLPILHQRPARALPWLAAGALGWFLVGSACSLVPTVQRTGSVLAYNYRFMSNPNILRQRQEEAALLTRVVPPGEKVLVAAPYSAVVHLRTKLPSVNSSSLYQMVLMDEFRQTEEFLRGSSSTPVLIDKNTFALQGWQFWDRGIRELADFLQKRYEVTAVTSSCYLFSARSDEPLLGDGKDEALLHLAVRDGVPASGLALTPFLTKAPWSLEMVLRPADELVNAVPLGNPPGVEGVVIQQEAPDLFALFVGDGKSLRRVLRFPMQPGEWNYLAVVRSPDAFTVYLDGEPAASNAAPRLHRESSPATVPVGAGVENSLPLNAEVKEVRVLNRAITAAEAAATARGVQEKLP
jgi:hypothetical protein